ncbi:hypothetical protein TSUD_246130 [Trifolium subterraneum]|uniref:Exocyst subunit Exo70 family protein n=1 Tax=Trifolium subterraneum TaxID=3900 RepID=A0A2Z6LH92_TRISU|nr:hypothetical protein TSUD_246130 [Trifolium subterraneum]
MEFGNMMFLTPDAEFDCWVDGGVHPMTCAATDYILMAFLSRKNLEQILREHPLVVSDGAGTSLFYSQMELIMEQFERKLEASANWNPFGMTDVAGDNEFLGIEDENFVVIEVRSHSPQLDSNNFGSMVEQLSTCLKALQLENFNLIEMLLEKLKEYRSDYSELIVSEPDFMINALPPEIIDNLKKIAKLMVSTGFERDFCDMYSRFRRKCLVESLSRLWFQKLSIEGLQMLSWKEMEDDIKRWIKASKVALKILLPTERRLCDQVFFGFSAIADLSFTDVCMESTLELLSFTKAMAIVRRSPEPERLFRIL